MAAPPSAQGLHSRKSGTKLVDRSMTDLLATEIARIAGDPALTSNAAVERVAQAIVSRNDSARVVALAWALLQAVQREGEVDWVGEGLEPAPIKEDVSEHILVTLRGLSSHEAAGALFVVVASALDGLTDASFEEWCRLVRRLRRACTAKTPSVN